MTLDDLKSLAANLFPIAVTNAIHYPDKTNKELEELERLCRSHHQEFGFSCMADCFSAIAPRSDGKLDITNWSSAEIESHHWRFRVRCRPFRLSSTSAHLEIHHDGPLPGVTQTGYRSIFAPMAKFSEITPEDFIRSEICKNLPDSAQMTLF